MTKKKTTFLFLKRLIQWMNYGFKYLRLRVLPQSLFYRFILIILVPLIVLQIVIAIFFYDRHWDTVSRRFALDIAGEVQVIASVIKQRPDETVFNNLVATMDKDLSLKIIFKPEAILKERLDKTAKQPANLYYALKNLKYPMILKEMDDGKKMIVMQLPEGVLEIIVPKKRFFTSTVHVFLVWLIGSSILLFWLAFLFMKNQVRSIEKLSKASEFFGMGHTDFAFKPGGATEVRQAGYSFILMKNRIGRYLNERTAMLAGVSHDLRTPLTRMKLQLSMMPQDENTQDLTADIAEMEKMLIGYLSFAKGEGKEKPESIIMNSLMEEIIQKLKKTGQKIDFHSEQKIELLGRRADLMRAITNILTNAGRYASYTQVNLGIRDTMATITVDDNGPGIPENKRDAVFKAFYRLEESRNKETGGVGLGMTITRDIILSHGGDIKLQTSPLKGLRVVISLPLTPVDLS